MLKSQLYISASERKQNDSFAESKRVYERNVYVVKLTFAEKPLHIGDSERKQTDRLAESKRVYERNVYVVKLTPACESRLTVSQRVSEFTSET